MAEESIELVRGTAILEELSANCPDIVLPTGYVFQRTASAIVQSKDSSKMSATFAIVTRTSQPNRYGNQLQLMPNANGLGPVTNYYAQNPVVLFEHGMGGISLPIGLSKPNDGPLSLAWSATQGIATCYFSDQPWAVPIFAAIDDGLLKMASIGFDPILAMRLKTAGPSNPDGAAPKPSKGAGSDSVIGCNWLGMDFVEWELLEWSVVLIGADRGALRQCLDRGHIHGVKLSSALRQSFSQHAAELDQPGIGMELQKKDEAPKCSKCGSELQCVQCTKQDDPAEPPEPDIAPDQSMAYPSADSLALACAFTQSEIESVESRILKGIGQAVQLAVKPVAENVSAIANEFKRVTGKLE